MLDSSLVSEVGDNTYRDGMADQNNTENSFIQYDIEFGGEYVSFDQRKMNAVRAVSAFPASFQIHPSARTLISRAVFRMDAH